MTPAVRSSPLRPEAPVLLLVTNETGLGVSPIGTPQVFGAGIRTGPVSFADRYAWTPREGGARG